MPIDKTKAAEPISLMREAAKGGQEGPPQQDEEGSSREGQGAIEEETSQKVGS